MKTRKVTTIMTMIKIGNKTKRKKNSAWAQS
jgi:hypothetical protein